MYTRHLIYGPPDRYFAEQAVDRMRELLEAGFTTIQAGGDDNAAILELKRRVERGEIKGPRILAAYRVATGRLNSDEEIRNAVRTAKSAGYDSIAEVIYPQAPPPAPPTGKRDPQPCRGAGRRSQNRPAGSDPCCQSR